MRSAIPASSPISSAALDLALFSDSSSVCALTTWSVSGVASAEGLGTGSASWLWLSVEESWLREEVEVDGWGEGASWAGEGGQAWARDLGELGLALLYA